MRHGELTQVELRTVLGDIGARAANLGTTEGDRIAKRALLCVGKLDAFVLTEGHLQREFKQLCDVAGDLIALVRKGEKKQ